MQVIQLPAVDELEGPQYRNRVRSDLNDRGLEGQVIFSLAPESGFEPDDSHRSEHGDSDPDGECPPVVHAPRSSSLHPPADPA